jgi:DNA modification methylase
LSRKLVRSPLQPTQESFYKLHNEDVLKSLQKMESGYFDCVLTDPPYGLSFMGKSWDYGVPGVEIWKEVYRVLKPGAAVLAFGGSRTYHRLACAIEDAGFEIRDCMMWIYASGFPKSYDISKGIDKAAGATREVVGPNRWSGRRTEGSGPENGDSCYGQYGIPGGETVPATEEAKRWEGYGTALKPAFEPIILAMKPLQGTFVENALEKKVAGFNIDGSKIMTEDGIGRWPSNFIHDGSDEVLSMFPNNSKNESYSRFFYCAKAGKAEREAGLSDQDPILERDGSSSVRKNIHPTVKPLALIKYLANLILPPKRDCDNRKLLVPFSGSGSEMIGAMIMGWEEIHGIEIDEEYIRIAQARLDHWKGKI